ncbi:MAG: hypothetical protein MZW92_08100 [Comamonadaceae bacterium]|nr:hypothetical protein [Comamonadaceae bacterium]
MRSCRRAFINWAADSCGANCAEPVPAGGGGHRARRHRPAPCRPARRRRRLWLRRDDPAAAPEALSLRVFRLVDDDVPLAVTTRYEIAAGGLAELILPAAALPDFLPLSLNSPLPARLGDDGRLRLQLRPGNWVVEVGGRHSSPSRD